MDNLVCIPGSAGGQTPTKGLPRLFPSSECEQRLLAITGEIVDTRMLAIFFFGSLMPLILVISPLCT